MNCITSMTQRLHLCKIHFSKRSSDQKFNFPCTSQWLRDRHQVYVYYRVVRMLIMPFSSNQELRSVALLSLSGQLPFSWTFTTPCHCIQNRQQGNNAWASPLSGSMSHASKECCRYKINSHHSWKRAEVLLDTVSSLVSRIYSIWSQWILWPGGDLGGLSMMTTWLYEHWAAPVPFTHALPKGQVCGGACQTNAVPGHVGEREQSGRAW